LATGSIAKVKACVPALEQPWCKIAAESAVRRDCETNCRLHSAAGRPERYSVHTRSSSAHQYRGKYAAVPEGSQAAEKSAEEDVKETAESNEEIREGATEGRQFEPPH
jgi:hypothetical protein